jgi:dynein heavy chain
MCLSKLLMRKDQLRILRESVMLIVRDYNNIISLVNVKETNLFSDHLRQLDKVIETGLTKINW